MQCPACGKSDNSVIDSRPMKEGTGIRRRRRCLACEGRFTTFESTEEQILPLLMKKYSGQGMRKKDIDTVLSSTSRAFMGLADEMERLISKPGRPEKSKVTEELEKKFSKTPRKKAVSRIAPKEKAPPPTATVRKGGRETAAAKLLEVVKRHKRGIDIGRLKDTTGIDEATIRLILFRAHKQGKITRIARGIYVAS